MVAIGRRQKAKAKKKKGKRQKPKAEGKGKSQRQKAKAEGIPCSFEAIGLKCILCCVEPREPCTPFTAF